MVDVRAEQAELVQRRHGPGETGHADVDRDRQPELAGEGEVILGGLGGGERGTAQRQAHPQPPTDPVRKVFLLRAPRVVGVPGRGDTEERRAVRARAAVQEHAPDPGIVQRAHIRVGVPGRGQVVRPVRDGRDPGVEGLQRAPQRAGVEALRRVVRRQARDHRTGVAGQRDLAGVTAERSLPDVAMGVDQAGQHQAPTGINHSRARRT